SVFAANFCFARCDLRECVGVWIYSAALLGLAFAVFSRGVVFAQSRLAGVDSRRDSGRHRPFGFLVARVGRWKPNSRFSAGVLSAHCVLSGLGRNLVVRESVFYFADGPFHPGPERVVRPRREMVPFFTRCPGDRLFGSCVPDCLEHGVRVSVGYAFGSGARAHCLERDAAQSILCRAARDFRQGTDLSFPSCQPNAADLTARNGGDGEAEYSVVVDSRLGRRKPVVSFVLCSQMHLALFPCDRGAQVRVPVLLDAADRGGARRRAEQAGQCLRWIKFGSDEFRASASLLL